MKTLAASSSKVRMGTIIAALITSLCLGCGGGGGGDGEATVAPASGSAQTTTAAATPSATPSTGSGGLISGCTTTGSTSAIALTGTPSRVSGVAPLAVFFDATATTATSTSRSFHDLEYRWNFGETAGPGVGTWGTGARPGANSRNAAKGPMAGHVFETPGTYTINLTVTNGSNTVSNSCLQISVQDPNSVFSGSNTVCFSGAGNFIGCPSGAAHVTTSNATTAVSANIGAGKRLLFSRGETFNAASSVDINANGPGLVGAFGSGVKPVIRWTGSGTGTDSLINFSGFASGAGSQKDWRLMDIQVNGNAGVWSGVGAGGGMDQITILRVDVSHARIGFAFDPGVIDLAPASHHFWDQLSIVDSSAKLPYNQNGTAYCAYLSGERFLFAGNDFGDSGYVTTHNMRNVYLGKAIINNNTFSYSAVDRHLLKIHAPDQSSLGKAASSLGAGFSRWIIISDNKFEHGGAWQVTLAPENSITDNRIRDVIIERNYSTLADPTSQLAFYVSAADATIRNNVIDMSGASSGQTGISLLRRGIEPASNGWIYNNTIYTSSPLGNAAFLGIDIDSSVISAVVKNNLMHAPNATNPIEVNNSCGACLTLSNNTADATVNPNFTSTSPFNPTNAKPRSGSYAIGNGVTVPVWSDFFDVATPGAPDMGAVVH